MEKFDYTPEGYLDAKEYLKSIGEWDRVSKGGLSTDGYSIVQSANDIYKKNYPLNMLLPFSKGE